MNSVKRPVALVTGASAGIGKSIVKQLQQDGWKVYGAARRVEAMRDIEKEGASVLALDVTDDQSMQTCIDTIIQQEGQIDALVNNAGYGSYGTVEDVDIDEARRQFEVNVFGLARLTQLVLPHMREANQGRIVNISSMGGRIWMPVGGWYHATKYCVEVLSDALRLETKPFGIHVSVIQPGAIESEWSGIAADNLKKTAKTSPYQKIVQAMVNALTNYDSASKPEVIAKAVSKALNSKKPKRRYAAPFDAKALIFLHWIMPDRIWDRFIMMALKAS
ncbi:oxidoreductase [Maricurvus nonylphenolicus]|uniref:oxidoreductase n=1 Tax=Maricurvus nonylphenolicus TaxID=1008307 RepID=UPI0036F1B747